MTLLGNAFIILMAFLHIVFMALEMFLWQTPLGKKIFHLSNEKAAYTVELARNQGLYNGFLAAGLIWSFFIIDPGYQYDVRMFFLACMFIAGVFGAYTVKKSILYIQALPAFLTIIAINIT